MEYINGLVSVIMPTYRRSDKLVRAIESVLKQSYRDIELLLVNDNDPEDEYTLELKSRVEPFQKDERFHLIMQDRHINGAVARNVGIKVARGQYVAFLDDDDWWEENKLFVQVRALESLDNSWGGVSCKFTLFNETGEKIGRSLKYRDGYIYKDILALLSDVATGTLLLRREALDVVGYFDENLLRHQDLQLLVHFTFKYKLKEINQYLHCVDVSDTLNRPDIQKLITCKKAFFKSVDDVMKKISIKEKREIYAMHRYELGYVCLKSGDRKQGIRYCLAVFRSPRVFFMALKKTINKVAQRFV